jgi:hypothetical protein
MTGVVMSSLRRRLGRRADFLSRVMGRALRRVTMVAGVSLGVVGLSVVPVAIQATANPAKADAATEAVLIVGAGVSDGPQLHPVNVIYSTAESPASKNPGWLDLPVSGYTCRQGKIRAWCNLGAYYEVILYHDGEPEEVLDWQDVKVTVDPGHEASRIQYKVQGSSTGHRLISKPTILAFEACSPHWLECGELPEETPSRGSSPLFTLRSDRNMKGGHIVFAFFISFDVSGDINPGLKSYEMRTGQAACSATGNELCNF